MPSSLVLDERILERKSEILSYFRHRAAEALGEIKQIYGETQYKKRASATNQALIEEKDRIVSQIRQIAVREHWGNSQTLNSVLLITYCSNLVMLESRNSVWAYEYMSFSRRIGELWDPFCQLCFEFPSRDDVALFIPPLFESVRQRLANEIKAYIASLPLTDEQKASLLRYYNQVWGLVTSGEIKLALDLHFLIGETRYVVDFKSGFGSNEKGNTNRLLLVASVYKNIEPEDYHCLILVRSVEDENNHYLQTLKNSGLWEVFCGPDAYAQIQNYSGFDIADWISKNIAWEDDLTEETRIQLESRDLLRYLSW